jgi:hypothetical protein
MTDLTTTETTIINPGYNGDGCYEITVGILGRTFRVTCDCEANPETTIETTADRLHLTDADRLADFVHTAECSVIDYINDAF